MSILSKYESYLGFSQSALDVKARSVQVISENIINDIKWLGMLWDEEIIFQRQNQDKHKNIIFPGYSFSRQSCNPTRLSTESRLVAARVTRLLQTWGRVSMWSEESAFRVCVEQVARLHG